MITFIHKSFAHFKVAVVGGGTGGVTLSGHLASRLSGGIAIFQPHQKHLYQPAQTMVGGGIACQSQVQRSQEKMIPKGVQWFKDRIQSVSPQNNQFISGGKIHTYQQLVLSTGVQCCFQDIKGAVQALQDPDCPVGSIYKLSYAIKFNNILSRINKGNFIFTQPVLPIKCAGAPQKIIHLSWDRLDKSRSQVKYFKAGGVVFGVPKYSAALQNLYVKKNVKVNLKQNLIQVRGKQRIAVFQNVENKVRTQQKFDVLHLVPPQRPHSYISQSGLADSTGYLLVDNQTLRSKIYKNVWGLGDCTSTPNSKTAAAIMSQGPVLAQYESNQEYTSSFAKQIACSEI